MKIEDLVAENIGIWKAMVEEAGGIWEGVQMPIFCDGGADAEPLVFFRRNGFLNPVSLPVSQMSVDAVKQKMGIKTTPNVVKQTQVDFTGLEKKLQAQLTPVREVLREFLNELDKLEEELKNAEK